MRESFKELALAFVLLHGSAVMAAPAHEATDAPAPAVAATPPIFSMSAFEAVTSLPKSGMQLVDTVKDSTSGLIDKAMSLIGTPYKRGGLSEDTGFDCSGFVRTIYQQTFGLVLPHRAAEQAKLTLKIDPKELKPGDLVFYNTMRRAFSHVGVYIGDGKFVHSPRAGGEVRVEDMKDSYWIKRFNGARRVDVQDDNKS